MLNKIGKLFNNTAKNKEESVFIPIDKILLGGEHDTDGLKYVKLTGDIYRTSTRVIDGPHCKLLEAYLNMGEELFKTENFIKTDYYLNAQKCINYLGSYFDDINSPDKIIFAAKRYIKSFNGENIDEFSNRGHDNFNDPIIVKKICNSNYFQVINGSHRISSRYIRGEKLIKAIIRPGVVNTFFSDLVSDVFWDKQGFLYQPISLPEFDDFVKIRKCTDRFIKIERFIKEMELNFDELNVLDVGSYFGWFVNEFNKLGFNSYGLERDYSACLISNLMFNIPHSNIFNTTIEEFLINDCNVEFDVVNFLSVLHHFTMGKSYLSDEFVFQKFSEMTKKIMFFETGHEQEHMFGDKLKGWNDKSIESFVKNNSDFKLVINLGQDEDGVSSFENNYKRTLFALVK